MDRDVFDWQAQHWLRSYINELPPQQREQLKSVRMCGSKPVSQLGAEPAVFLLSDGKSSLFFGQTHCKNPWCCPVCSAYIMSHYRTKIAAAIDLLKEDYFGFMVTLTIPHLAFMQCRETLDILYNTWRYFSSRHYNKKFHVFTNFKLNVELAHHVRVTEFTYGSNGWNPHFHCIFWVPRKHADKVLAWESQLDTFWKHCAKTMTLKYWTQHNLHRNIEPELSKLANRLFAFKTTSYSLVFSKNKNGNLIETTSSNYVTGWTSDLELSGLSMKTAKKGHRTPYQILQDSYNDPKSKQLYLDYCLAVTQKPVHHRLRFSNTGIHPQVIEHMKISKLKHIIEQKKSSTKVVTWFDALQWSHLLFENVTKPVFANILYLANKKDLLREYLLSLGIKMHEEDHKWTSLVEEIFSKNLKECA